MSNTISNFISNDVKNIKLRSKIKDLWISKDEYTL